MAPAYRIGKGPIVAALEQFLIEGDVETWYMQLANEERYLLTLEATEFDAFVADRDGAAHTHLTQDVFGPGRNAAQLPANQREAAEKKGLSRRLVYGRGLRRAIEIAYGFGDDDQPALDEPWTIDVYWGCGQPYNLVGLRTNAAKKALTVIIYSDEAATGDERGTVLPRDPATRMAPDPAGDLFIVDDRAGVGELKEWRATRVIGLPNSPDPV